MDQNTTFIEVQTMFHSMPLTKYALAAELEQEWLKIAVADYELELSCDLHYDADKCIFASRLDGKVVRVLALMMYVCYLQRELSRVMALNRIYTKDLQITGGDSTKRVTKQELESEIARVDVLLHKAKTHAYN